MNTRRIIKSILIFSFSIFIFSTIISCGRAEGSIADKADSTLNSNTNKGKILIVLFSRAGENYAVGQVSIGNTARMAGFIKDYSGGTLFEITPTIPYPNSYEETKKISQQETKQNARPAIKNLLENLDQYSIVFVGSPIWYGNPPMIMRTFYETYKVKLASKTLIPFGTHEGSGISSSLTLMKEYFPNAKILESLGIKGQHVNDSRQIIEEWLGRIGIQKKQG